MRSESSAIPTVAGIRPRQASVTAVGDPYRLRNRAELPDNSRMSAGRTKRKLKNRPKFKIARRLKGRKMKAKKKAAHKRGLGRSKKRRQNRGKK